MNIVMVLSNAFILDPRVSNEARSLAEGGHRVTVVAWDRSREAPEFERVGEVDVVRVYNTRAMDRLPYDILRLRPFQRLALDRIMDLHRDRPVDVVHCHDFDTLPVGVALKRRLGIPLVYDAHEIWGEMVGRDLPRPLVRWFLAKERRLLRDVDRMIVENEPMRAYYRRAGRDAFPIVIVMNAKPVFVDRYQPPDNDVLEVLYLGTLNESRFLLGSIAALAGVEKVSLRIGGIGKPAYLERLQAACAAAPNVTFLGLIPKDEVLPATLACDVVLCMTDPADPNNRIATANKQFEAMSTGRPIVVSDGTFLAEFTRQHDVGVVAPHTVEGVREAIVRLRDDGALRERLGRQALEKARGGFNWTSQQERLLAAYEELASPVPKGAL